MRSKKAKKDSKAKAAVRTSPRKQKASRDADPDEDSQEQSQEPSEEPERREALPEGDEAKGPEGDGEKTDKVDTCLVSDPTKTEVCACPIISVARSSLVFHFPILPGR